ncbi:MAG TPA: superoxide dismutase, partial [Chitinophagaceae bacterium]|nr:superoxide dismutase [Chitinophagaceae bacterium]
MSHQSSRRNFVKTSGKAGLAIGLAATLPSVLRAGVTATNEFQQQALPYMYNALEPSIDALTMEIHYSKHAAAYAKSLGEACTAEGV